MFILFCVMPFCECRVKEYVYGRFISFRAVRVVRAIGNQASFNEDVPKTIPYPSPPVKASDMRLIQVGLRSIWNPSYRSNIPELSARLFGEGVNIMGIEVSTLSVLNLLSIQNAIIIEEAKNPGKRVSNEFLGEAAYGANDVALYELLGNQIWPSQTPSSIPFSPIPMRVRRVKYSTYYYYGDMDMRRFPLNEIWKYVDPMQFKGTSKSTASVISVPGETIWWNDVGQEYMRPTRSPGEPNSSPYDRPEVCQKAGIDVADDFVMRPSRNSNTGRLADRSQTMYVSSEMIAFYTIPEGMPNAWKVSDLLFSTNELNMDQILTEVPDELYGLMDSTVYGFMPKIKTLRDIAHLLIPVAYRTIALFENRIGFGGKGPAYHPGIVKTRTFFMIRRVYFAGVFGIPIENSAALAVIGAHGVGNGDTGKMLRCISATENCGWTFYNPVIDPANPLSSIFSVLNADPINVATQIYMMGKYPGGASLPCNFKANCGVLYHDPITNPDNIASLIPCYPESVPIGYFCYDWWDGVQSVQVISSNSGEHTVIETRIQDKSLLAFMRLPDFSIEQGETSNAATKKLQADTFCNIICGHYSDELSAICVFCFQTKRKCTMPYPYYVHITNGCTLNLAGNWICADMCLQDCDPAYYEIACKPGTFGDYDDYTYTQEAYNKAISRPAGATINNLESTGCKKVYLFNYGGKCCLQCPVGFYNPTCYGHQAIDDERSYSLNVDLVVGDIGTCRSCSFLSGSVFNAFCTEFEDRRADCSQCNTGHYATTFCGPDTDYVCSPCKTCLVGEITSGECGPARDSIICTACPPPNPDPVVFKGTFTMKQGCDFECNAGYQYVRYSQMGRTLSTSLLQRDACCQQCTLSRTFIFVKCSPTSAVVCKECTVCLPGSFYIRKCSITEDAVCQPARAGTYSVQPEKGWITCPPGTYQNQDGQTSCKSCPDNTYLPAFVNSQSDITDCIPVDAGYQSSADRTYQIMYCVNGSFFENTCTKCPFPKTTFPNFVYRSIDDCVCPLGMARPTRTSCPTCMLSVNIPEASQSTCVTCMDGTYSGILNSSYCVPCAKSSYSYNLVLVSASASYEDRFAAAQIRSSCKQCTIGKYTYTEGSISEYSCISCLGGYYCNNTGIFSCPKGFYCPTGSSQPVTCLPSELCDLLNLEYPVRFRRCPVGKYNKDPTHCLPCPYRYDGRYHAYFQPSNLSKGNCLVSKPGVAYSTCFKIGSEPCPSGCICNGDGNLYNQLPSDLLDMKLGAICGDVQNGMDVCQPCAAGTYAEDFFLTACVTCADGKYTSSVGIDYPCDLCPIGQFCPRRGLAQGYYCGSGYYASIMGMSACTSCGVGTYNIARGASECISCTLGFFNVLNGSSFCTACPSGTLSYTTNPTTCHTCEPGTFNFGEGHSACYSCSSGYYHTPPDTTCRTCIPGFYSQKSDATLCISCLAGTFSGTSGMSECISCAPGRYGIQRGSSVCTFCSSGSYNEFEGMTYCVQCLFGMYASGPGSTSCLLCDIGKYLSDTGLSTCKSCTPGFFSSMSGASSCLNCMKGTFQSEPGSSVCNTCGVGTYSDRQGGSICLLCASGQYGSGLASTICTFCGINTFSPRRGLDACEICGVGLVAATIGMSTCTRCFPGTFKPVSYIIQCNPCDVGKYNDFYGSSSCIACNGNNYTSNVSATSCTECEPGSWVSHDSHGSCSLCEPGTYKLRQTVGNCSYCIPGTYQSGYGMSFCNQCVPGQFSQGISGTTCSVCFIGSFMPFYGYSECFQCNSGKYQSTSGSILCQSCTFGKYNNNTGQTECIACSLGEYSSQQGQTQCQQCEPGTYLNKTYTALCFQCPVGTFTDKNASTTCKSCSPGLYASSIGSTSCSLCQRTTFTAYYGRDLCDICGVATYSASDGLSVCTLCPTGTFSDMIGVSECEACPKGSFQSTVGSSQCVHCPAGTYTFHQRMEQCECLLCALGQYSILFLNETGYVCAPCPRGHYCTPCNAPVVCPAGTYHRLFTTDPSFDRIYQSYSYYQEIINGSIVTHPCQLPCICNSSLVRENWIPEFGICGDLTGLALTPDACVSCVAGTYTSLSGQTVCSQCLPGYYSFESGASQNSTCKYCDVGYYSTGYGSHGCYKCQDCSGSTTYRPGPCGGNQTSTCVPCRIPFGTYYAYSIRDGLTEDCLYKQCSVCPVGKYYHLVCTRYRNAVCRDCSEYWDPLRKWQDYSPFYVPIGNYFLPPNVTYTAIGGYWDGSYNVNQPCAYAPCTECTELGSYMKATCSFLEGTKCENCTKPESTFWTTDGRSAATSCQYQQCSLRCPKGTYMISACTNYNNITCAECIFKDNYTEWYYHETLDCQFRPCVLTPYYYFYGVECSQQVQCTLCNQTGQYYRSECTMTRDAVCGWCTNKPINTKYVSAGVPANADNCTFQTSCESGYYTTNNTCTTCFTFEYNPCFYGRTLAGYMIGSCNPTDTQDTQMCKCIVGFYQASRFSCLPCRTASVCSTGSTFVGTCGPTETIDSTYCKCNIGYFQAGLFICEQCITLNWCLPSKGGYLAGHCNINDTFDESFCVCPPGEEVRVRRCLRSCQPGRYRSTFSSNTNPEDDLCLACPMGTYTADTGSTTCKYCPTGTYHILTGATSNTDCVGCNPGSYLSWTGYPKCSLCGLNTYSYLVNQVACLLCPNGTYSTSLGASSLSGCMGCPEGTYMPNTDVRDCAACGPGTYQTGTGYYGTSLQCLTCVVGKYFSGSGATSVTDCVDCLPGYYGTMLNNIPACILCTYGTYQTGYGLIGSTSCMDCVAGKYQSVAGSINCSNCAYGKYQQQYRAQSETQCKDCDIGKFSDPWNLMCICGAGSFSNTTNGPCFACKIINVSACGPSSKSFYECSGSGYKDTSRCFCGPGWYADSSGVCLQCPPGTYQAGTGNMWSTPVCQDCVKGTYQTTWGAVGFWLCLACSAGTYSSKVKLSSPSQCDLCSSGTFQTGEGMTTQDNCMACEKGKYQSVQGATTYSQCKSCPSGTYSSLLGVFYVSECKLCKQGTFQTGLGMTSNTSCQSCPLGTYQSTFGVSTLESCILCSAGTVGTAVGMSNASQCKKCGMGTYLTGAGCTSEFSCEFCPNGTYGTGIGMNHLTNCSLCISGSFQTGYGMWSSSFCLLCEKGKFSISPNFFKCSGCQPGTFNTGLGLANCTLCDVGSYMDDSNATLCKLCSVGTFQKTPGSTTCDSCYMGFYAYNNGTSECEWCPVGKYADYLQGSACLLCSTGKYQSLPGTSECVSCHVGTYISSEGTYWNNKKGDRSVIQEGTYVGYNLSIGYGLDTVIYLDFNEISLANDPRARFIVYECDSLDCERYVIKYTFIGSFNFSSGMSLVIASGFVRVTLLVRVSCVGGLAKCGPAYYAVCGEDLMHCYFDVKWRLKLTGFCNQCSSGTYTTLYASNNCKQCEQGYYQSAPGSTGCKVCEKGKVSLETGTTQCLLCARGRYKPTEFQLDCDSCGFGEYQSETGSTQCQWCAQGLFNNQVSSSVCQLCPQGTSGEGPMQTECLSCTIGTFTSSVGSTICDSCGPGSYGNYSGLSTCSFCYPGTYQNTIRSSSCYSCVDGTYFTGTGNTDGCVKCSYTYVNGSGATSYDQVCRGCASGYYEEQTQCQTCPMGTYSYDISSSSCAKCPIGTYGNDIGLFTVTQCLECPLGSYGVSSGMSECELCPPRTFGATPNSANCTPCSPGFYGYLYGQSSCLPCTRGSYSSLLGSYYDNCILCKAGSYASKDGSSTCNFCSIGTYSDRGGSFICYGCKIGTYQNSTNQTYCISCSPGSYAGDYSSTTCTNCLPGSYQDKYEGGECILCPTGTYMSVLGWSLGTCTKCVSGTYLTFQGSPSYSDCTLCYPGFASSVTGLNNSFGCHMCPLGTVALPNKSSCIACVGSTFCPPGYDNPIECVYGLVCNGSHISSPPRYLFVIASNCTVLLECPKGTQCSIGSEKGILNGPYSPSFDLPVFAIRQYGLQETTTSCNTSFLYDSIRVDTWESVWEQSNILFWLAPRVCPAGMYLLYDTCTSCSLGYFSSLEVAYSNATCVACSEGTYQNQSNAYLVASCKVCGAGSFSSLSGQSVCILCDCGKYQSLQGKTGCSLCSPGTYTNNTGAKICQECPRDTFQNGSGYSSCNACLPGEYSSVGDIQCTSCSVATAPPAPWCSTPQIPTHTKSMWISVRGEQDECLAQGDTYFEDSETIARQIYINTTSATCYHSMRVLGRPDLTHEWPVTVYDFRRPVSVEVISFNNTFYPGLCKTQGFSVLYVVRDNRSESMIDTQDMTAVMRIYDFVSNTQLYKVDCSHLPVLSEDVIYGTCKTSNFCPNQKIRVYVTLSWPSGSTQGLTVMTPGPTVFFKSTLNWIMSFQVLSVEVPYFAGDRVQIQVFSQNTPGTIAVYRFAVTFGPNVIFRRFSSAYTVVSDVQNGTLSVVGQTTSDLGDILGILEVTLLTDQIGVFEIGRVLLSFCEITLSDSISYPMSSRLKVWSYPSETTNGIISILMDSPRYTKLISRARKNNLIQWQALSSSAVMYPTKIKTLAIMNIMDRFEYVSATCSTSSAYLVVTSCDNIKATGKGLGDPYARVQVTFKSLSVTIGFAVFIPQPAKTTLFPQSLALQGHYKMFSHFYSGAVVLYNIDVTPYIDPIALRVIIRNQEWSCPGEGPFIIGSASGVCGPPVSFLIQSVFIWNIGVPGLGHYLLIPSRITPASPSGGLLVFNEAGNIIEPLRVESGDTRRLEVTFNYQRVTLVSHGETSRCVKLVINGATIFFIPVWSPVPNGLQMEFTSRILLSTLDNSGFLPYNATLSGLWMNVNENLQSLNIANYTVIITPLVNNTVEVHGLTVSSTSVYGQLSVTSRILEISCIAGAYVFRVVPKAAGDPILIYVGQGFLTLQDDPLSIMFPTLFPSGLNTSVCYLVYTLVDDTVKVIPASIVATGTSNITQNSSIISATHAGFIELSDNRANNTILIPVVQRAAVSVGILCNSVDCANVNLTQPGDGASLPPFLYNTTLQVGLSIKLWNGSVIQLTPHALGVEIKANQSSLLDSVVPLQSGPIHISIFMGSEWQLPNITVSVQVESLNVILSTAPPVLRQIHNSGIWEEFVVTTKAQLSNGVDSIVEANCTSQHPLVKHAPNQFHLDYYVVNTYVVCSFGGRESTVLVNVTKDSLCVTKLDISFLPAMWTGVYDSHIELIPKMFPMWNTPWISVWNLSSIIVAWTSSQPSILRIVNATQKNPVIYLVDDYYEPVSIHADLLACNSRGYGNRETVYITPNIDPNVDGQLDLGLERGLMVEPTKINSVVNVPVFMFASRALQTFTLEITYPNQAIDVETCMSSDIRDSQCVLAKGSDNSVYVRSVGSYVSSILSGRVRLATLEIHVKLHALIEISLYVPQFVAYGKVRRNISKTYTIMVGAVQSGRRLMSFENIQVGTPQRRLLSRETQVWGDVDGDGECTSLDAQFLQLYLMYQAFTGDQQICVESCQWRSTLTPWQLSQLNPIRNPLGPPSPPDGASVLYYLRALVKKYHFLSNWTVNVTTGSFKMYVEFTDYTGKRPPANTQVSIWLSTKVNIHLSFTTSFQNKYGGMLVSAEVDESGGGYYVSTIPNTAIFAEYMIPVKIMLETQDIYGKPALDRQFTFYPSKPFTFVSLIASNLSSEESLPSEYIPIENCTDLCEDVLYFDDFYSGIPVWSQNILRLTYALRFPVMQTAWFILDSIYEQAAPVSVKHWINATTTNTSYPLTVSFVVTVDSVFTVVFNATHLSMGYDVIQVTGLIPTNVTGAHYMNCLFVTWPNQRIYLDFQVSQEGYYSILFSSLSNQSVVLEYTVWARKPALPDRLLLITPLCQQVIMWSFLGGRDEPCTVNISESSVTLQQYVCLTYPCWISHENTSYLVAVQTFIPYRPQIIVQQNIIRELGRTPWIATVSLWSDSSIFTDVAVTQMVLNQGLVFAYPKTAVTITPRWITGVHRGLCTLYFGKMGVVVNVTFEPHAIMSLDSFALYNVSVVYQDPENVDFKWITSRFPADSMGYLIIRVVYANGFTIRLDPTLDAGLYVEPLHHGIRLYTDLSFRVKEDIEYFEGQLFFIEWKNWSITVNGTLIPYIPSRLQVCCSQYITYPSSPAKGLGDYKSQFTLESLELSYVNHALEVLKITDPRISVEYDQQVLSYYNGYWTVLDVPGTPLGPTEITVVYTHPVSLFSTRTTLSMIVVDAQDFLVSVEFDPGTLQAQLFRLHCSNVFQSAFILATVDLGIDRIDVTGDIQILSSNPRVIRMFQNEARGMHPGFAELLVFYRGFTRTITIEVVDASVHLLTMIYHGPDVLEGSRFSVHPLELGGIFQGQDQSSSFVVSNITNLLPLVETSNEVELLPDYSMRILRNTYDASPGSISIKLPPCGEHVPDDLWVDLHVNLQLSSKNPTDVDFGITPMTSMVPYGLSMIPVWIQTSAQGSISYYLEIHTSLNVQGCTRGLDTLGFFECTIHDPMGVILIAGSGIPTSPGVYHVVNVITEPTTGNESLCGRLEIFGDSGVKTFNITAGLLGEECVFQDSSSNPIVDTSVIARDYLCLLGITSPCTNTLVDSWYRLLILVHKQRLVVPVVYSNDMEFSVMIQVLDRFDAPDTSRVHVNITLMSNFLKVPCRFCDTMLVTVDDYRLIPNVLHYQEGWYMAQWRLKIPIGNITVKFEIETFDDHGMSEPSRHWISSPIVANISTGRALPNCPHSSYDASVIESTYTLYLTNASNFTFDEIRDMQRSLGCSIDSTSRRVQISMVDNDKIIVQVSLESFLRLHEVNSFILDTEMMRAWIAAYNRTLLKVERRTTKYRHTPADPVLVCPVGYFFNESAAFDTLPQHASAGLDCYGFVCWPDYEPYGPDCIPKTTHDNVFWSSILLVLTLILAITTTSCFMRMSSWGLESHAVPEPQADIQTAPVLDKNANVLPIDVAVHDGAMSLVFEELSHLSDASSSESDQQDLEDSLADDLLNCVK